jgi:hypothetical protein
MIRPGSLRAVRHQPNPARSSCPRRPSRRPAAPAVVAQGDGAGRGLTLKFPWARAELLVDVVFDCLEQSICRGEKIEMRATHPSYPYTQPRSPARAPKPPGLAVRSRLLTREDKSAPM